MAELQTPIDTLRQRLNGLLADWGAELSLVLKELEEKRDRLDEINANVAGRDEQLQALTKRIEGQEALIETLRNDAAEASKLRRDIYLKDLEIERLNKEVAGQRAEVDSARRDAAAAQRLKDTLARKERQIERREQARRDAEERADSALRELAALREMASGDGAQSAEVEALRAELEARKTLIKSLRADAERARLLEARLEERREVIEKLEASINRHADTIVELKGATERWKRRYRDLKDQTTIVSEPVVEQASPNDTARETAEAPQSTEQASESVRDASQQSRDDAHAHLVDDLESVNGEHTIAIDMRHSLMEARRVAAGASETAPKAPEKK